MISKEAYKEKKHIDMYNWELSFYSGEYKLEGIAEYYPDYGKNVYLYRTSTILNHEYCDIRDEVIIETESSIYHCPLKYLNPKPYEDYVRNALEDYACCDKRSDDIFDKVMAASAKMAITNLMSRGDFKPSVRIIKDEFYKKLKRKMKQGQKELAELKKEQEEHLINEVEKYEDSVYLEVSNIYSGDPLAFHLGDDSGIVDPILHAGMFQDSVLYMKLWIESKTALDFRYFPKSSDTLETYSWSDNIKQAVIKNTRDRDITFNKEIVKPGEIKIFTPNTHRQGLVSPDCYNGKSIFSSKNFSPIEGFDDFQDLGGDIKDLTGQPGD